VALGQRADPITALHLQKLNAGQTRVGSVQVKIVINQHMKVRAPCQNLEIDR
jgi:hypothetical protein